MKFHRQLCVCLAAACAAAAPVQAAEITLAENSPFLPPGASASGAGAESGSLELRGIMSGSDGTRYYMYNPVKKKGVWAGVNESGLDFLIKSADPAHETVTFQSDGRTLTVPLHEGKVASLAPGAPGAPMGNPMNNQVAGAGAPVGAPPNMPVDQAARLQAIAAEVARRRQLREQGGQAGGPPADGQGQGQGGPRQRRQQQLAPQQ